MNTLQGTVALVTGASSGIGEATAVMLASMGAKVAIAARRRERLEELAHEIREKGGEPFVILADLLDSEQATRAVQSAVEHFGRLDILVNNAGLMLLGLALDAPLEEWDRMIDINLRGVMHCAHTALPHLIRAAEDSPRRVADMINISSVAGRVARATVSAYNATKFGVTAFSEALRQEVTRKYVRVSLVEPGYVATELQSHNRPDIVETLEARAGTREEALQADDVADAIGYIITRPRHVAINEILMRPTLQEG